jgi:hypothetical protein
MQTAPPPQPLTGPQLQLVQALLSGHTVASAAQAYDLPERTIRDWKCLPQFQAALQQGQAQLLQETSTLLSVAAAEAVKALVEVCQDPLEKGATRAAAAGRLLSLLFRHAGAVPAAFGEPFLSDDAPANPPLASSAVEPDRPQPRPAIAPPALRTGCASDDDGPDAEPAAAGEGGAPIADTWVLSGHPLGPPHDRRRPLTRGAPPAAGETAPEPVTAGTAPPLTGGGSASSRRKTAKSGRNRSR